MQTFLRVFLGLGLVSVGYLLGSTGILAPAVVQAQVAQAAPMTKEVQDSVKNATFAVESALQALVSENFYTPAITGVNAFAVTSGGANALKDLEEGRGVDPETFAGLYAGLAVDEIAEHLDKDEEGRLTYKNNVIRMYPISRLKQMFALRQQIATEGEQ